MASPAARAAVHQAALMNTPGGGAEPAVAGELVEPGRHRGLLAGERAGRERGRGSL